MAWSRQQYGRMNKQTGYCICKVFARTSSSFFIEFQIKSMYMSKGQENKIYEYVVTYLKVQVYYSIYKCTRVY